MDEKMNFVYDGEGDRLDVFLAGEMDGYSRNIIKEMIKGGCVTINGKKEDKPSFPLENGFAVEVVLPSNKKDASSLTDLIVFEDRHILVFDKPSGLIVHPQSPAWETNPEAAFTGDPSMVSMLLTAFPKMRELERAGLVHRLDRETSGVMIVAKTAEAQANLAAQFQGRQVSKLYNSVLCGEVPDDEGEIDVPIGRIAGGRIKASPIGRPSLTLYHVKKRANGYSWVDMEPKTGRTNQLRVHMAWLGYPVLGDSVYGGKPAARLMLHARRLEVHHPKTGKPVVFEVKPSADFNAEWKRVSKAAK